MKTTDILEALAIRFNRHFEWVDSYGEPGYHDDETLVVAGDYWCKCDGELHGIERHYPRIFARLADEGVEFEWYDEWYLDHETDKAYRTVADSYSWQSSIMFTDDGVLTPEDDIEDWVDEVKNACKCIPSRVFSEGDLVEAGFTKFGEGESGWHPGQDARPEDFLTRRGDRDMVFLLDRTGQFDLGFSAWVREGQ